MPSAKRTPKRKPAASRRRATARAAATRVAAAHDAPRDLEQALRDDPVASVAYRAMPPSHRKAYVEFVEEAKRPETRVRRVQQALRMMAQWGAEHPRRAAGPAAAKARSTSTARPATARAARKR